MTPSWASSGLPLFIFLFFVVFQRAQLTYWLGRAAAKGALTASGKKGLRGKIAAWFEGPVPRSGARLLEQWGIIIIPLCFLTVGVQTAVNAGAGIVRMSWKKYTLAMIPGCIAWSIMYGLGMLAVWMAVVRAAAGSVWGWLSLAAIAAIISAVVLMKRRRARKRAEPRARVSTCTSTFLRLLPPKDTGSREKTHFIACDIHRLHVELARSVRETHAEQREARMRQ